MTSAPPIRPIHPSQIALDTCLPAIPHHSPPRLFKGARENIPAFASSAHIRLSFTQTFAPPSSRPLSSRTLSAKLSMSAPRIRLIRRSQTALDAFLPAVPDLSDSRLYKGARGKVAVVGGSPAYTGAPFYAAMASLRGGGELSSIFCAAEAATAIKAYSPDVIVRPGLEALATPQLVRGALGAAHGVAVGPGLGREEAGVVRSLVRACLEDWAPRAVVLDADALWFVASDSEIRGMLHEVLYTPGAACVYLTPNVAELQRLYDAWGVADADGLAGLLNTPPPGFVAGEGCGRLILVRKGPVDRIHVFGAAADGCELVVDNDGGRKRCGGQGDILAGLLALFGGWAGQVEGVADDAFGGAAVAAALVTREAARIAFEEKGRSMVASDVIGTCGNAFEVLDAVK